MVPAMTTTPAAIRSVPRIAFSRPPPSPLVSVVSTLHLKFGTARATIPIVIQRAGATTSARQPKHASQNAALAIFLRGGTAGH